MLGLVVKTSSYAHISRSHWDRTFTMQLTFPFSAQRIAPFTPTFKSSTAEPQSFEEVGGGHPKGGADTVTRTLLTKMPLTVSKPLQALHELQLLTGEAQGLEKVWLFSSVTTESLCSPRISEEIPYTDEKRSHPSVAGVF